MNATNHSLLSAVLSLRNAAFALRTEIGATFAVNLAGGWKADGFQGMALALLALGRATQEVEGGWDVNSKARQLAARCFAAE